MSRLQPKTRLSPCTILLSLLFVACSEKPETLVLSAKRYMAQHDDKAAIIQIKNALQLNPNLPEARFLLGSALLETGDSMGAEAELRKAMDLKYPLDAVSPPLAKALLAQGQSRKLTEEFSQTALGDASAQASLQLSLASAYANQGLTEQAQTSIQAALKAQPQYPPALLERAKQLAGQGDTEGALALTDEVLNKTAQDSDAWKLKGDIYWHAQGKLKEAELAYRRAIQIKPDALESRLSIIELYFQQGNTESAEAEIEQLKHLAGNHPRTQYLAAQLAFFKKNYPLAKELAQQVLNALPANVQALQLAGAVELEMGNLSQAQTHLTKALDAAPALVPARRLLVMTYLRSGQPRNAMEVVLAGLDHKPVDPALYPLAGEVYLQHGDLGKAKIYFTKASQLAPHDKKNKTALALIHLRNGANDAAFEELRGIAASDSAPTADLALISEYLKRKEFDKALSAVDRLEGKQPTKPLAAHIRAGILLAQRDFDGARRSFERALALDPHYFPAVAGLAGMDWAANQPHAARKRFEDLVARDPHNVPALLALAELAERSGASKEEVTSLIGKAVAANPVDANGQMLLIEYHLKNKDTKDALTAAQAAEAVLPDNPQILDALGRAQQLTGDFNQAIATYSKLASMLPRSPLPFRRLANAQLAAKDKVAAISSLHKALAIQPDFLEAQRVLSGLYVAENRYQDAALIARSVQTQRPKEAAGYALEGDVWVAQKSWDAAIEAYRQGLKRVNTTELALKLHSALWNAEKPADADRFSKLWRKDHPNDSAFIFYLGDMALARQDFSSAENYYAAVIKLQPDSAIAYNNLAWVSAKLRKEGAMAYAEKAVALAPNQPTFMDTLAMLHSDRGDYAKAVVLETKALALQPLNAQLRMNLAKIHLKGGDRDLARKELSELSKLGAAFPEQMEVAALLKDL